MFDTDEEIDGAVAAVLAIVTFELTRLGWDRLADLADELGRAFIEAHHRVLRVRGFGVQVEHVFHACNVFRVDLGNALHVLSPWLQIVLGQTPAYRLAR